MFNPSFPGYQVTPSPWQIHSRLGLLHNEEGPRSSYTIVHPRSRIHPCGPILKDRIESSATRPGFVGITYQGRGVYLCAQQEAHVSLPQKRVGGVETIFLSSLGFSLARSCARERLCDEAARMRHFFYCAAYSAREGRGV